MIRRKIVASAILLALTSGLAAGPAIARPTQATTSASSIGLKPVLGGGPICDPRFCDPIDPIFGSVQIPDLELRFPICDPRFCDPIDFTFGDGWPQPVFDTSDQYRF